MSDISALGQITKVILDEDTTDENSRPERKQDSYLRHAAQDNLRIFRLSIGLGY